MKALTTSALVRRFGETVALDHLDLDLPRGGVIGLLGPNGSGKSTLIRILLGLVRPTSGSATVLGVGIEDQRSIAGQVGALIENPAFVPSLSARRNLLSLARLRGLGGDRIQEVIDVVGLTGRDREPVSRFSLGMKQRLGIAAALLPDPALLVLDEPTNGLDPAGIVEIRALLRRLADEGRTVLVSSHLLAEIEAACDWLVVIRPGELLFSGPIADLLARADRRVTLTAEDAEDHARLRTALLTAGWEVALVDGAIQVRAEDATRHVTGAELNRLAMAQGIVLDRLVTERDSLESVFLAMTR